MVDIKSSFSSALTTYSPNSVATTLDKPNAKVQIEMEHFSLTAILSTVVRFTQLRLLTRFNLMSFHYTLSVWLNKSFFYVTSSSKRTFLRLPFVVHV